jgi:hypothetical protein
VVMMGVWKDGDSGSRMIVLFCANVSWDL